jgi:hypothetical protein
MERRNFLRFAFGVAVGAAALAGAAQAAPLSPQPVGDKAPLVRSNTDAIPAVTSSDEAARLKPEQVRWHGGGWHHGGVASWLASRPPLGLAPSALAPALASPPLAPLVIAFRRTEARGSRERSPFHLRAQASKRRRAPNENGRAGETPRGHDVRSGDQIGRQRP